MNTQTANWNRLELLLKESSIKKPPTAPRTLAKLDDPRIIRCVRHKKSSTGSHYSGETMTSAREKTSTDVSSIKVRSLNDMAKTFVASRQGPTKAVTSLNQFTENNEEDKDMYLEGLNLDDIDENNDGDNYVNSVDFNDEINEIEEYIGNAKYRRCGSLNINERVPVADQSNSRKKQYLRQSSLEATIMNKKEEPVCGVEDNHLRELYRLKCQDLQIAVFNDPENRFVQGTKKKSTRAKLCLYESGFGPKAIEKLGQVVQNNAEIAQLCLRKSTLGGAAIRSFAKSLAMMPNLIHLELANNAIEPQDFIILLEELSSMQTLISIDFSNYEPDKKNKFTAECLGAFKKFANNNIYLQFVKLSNLMLEDEVIQGITEALEGCPNLLSVSLASNNSTGKCIEKLSPLLSQTTIIQLDFSNNKLRKEGATHLTKVIQDFKGINRPGLELILENTCIGGEINLVFTSMGRNTNVSKLNLSQNMLANVEMIRLETALTDTVKLMELNLSHCKIGESGGRILALGLQKNFSLQNLILAGNDLTDAIGAQIIYSLIANTNFKSLDMSQNKLSNESAKALQELIKKNPTVDKYNFSMNKINEKDGYLLQEVLHFNSRVIQFNLHHNPVKYNTIETIERIVKDNLRKRMLRAIPKLKHEVAKRRVLVSDEKQSMGNVEEMEKIKEDVERDVERFQNALATLKERPPSPTIKKNEKIVVRQGKEIKVNNQEYNEVVHKIKEFTHEALLETEDIKHMLEGVQVNVNQWSKKVEAKKKDIQKVKDKYDPEIKLLKHEISKLKQDNQFYQMYNDAVLQKIQKEKKKNTVANRVPAPKISDMFLATSELARHIRKNNESQERTMQESRSRAGMMESQSHFSQISDDSRVLREYNFALKSQRMRIGSLYSDKKDLSIKRNNRKLMKSEDPVKEAMKDKVKEKIKALLKSTEPKGQILDQIGDAQL